MIGLLLLLTVSCWFLFLIKPSRRYRPDWRLKGFELTPEEEQDFHLSVRKVISLSCAIFFSVCLIIVLAVRFAR